jgi:hypothetical protein
MPKIVKLRMEAMANHFLLITTDGETESGKRASARMLIDWRLERRRWPIYAGTRHKRTFQPGDFVLFYQGGNRPGRQHIVAQARIAGIITPKHDEEFDPPWLLSGTADQALVLDEVRALSEPVAIKPLMGEISILPKLRFWGALLMGGCRRLTVADYDLILAKSERPVRLTQANSSGG